MRKPIQVREYVDPSIAVEEWYRRNGEIVTAKAQRRRTCVHCGRPATKEAIFRKQGVTLIEKYCDQCMDLMLQNRLVRVTSTGHHTVRLTAG